MRITKRAAGIALAAAAGTLMFGSPAHANDNGGNSNNTQLAPVQLCNNDVAALGVVAPINSPKFVLGPCINGPVQGVTRPARLQ